MFKFSKFYNKSLVERHRILKETEILDNPEILKLDAELADNMIENYIANYQIPLGLAFNFVVNGQELIIPMAIEEPSVIAAASNGAKTLGNITTEITHRHAVGQIVLHGLSDLDEAEELVLSKSDLLFDMANSVSQSMVNRGGGLKSIWTEQFDSEFLTIYFAIDTRDAMGANNVNTILEHLAPFLEELTGSRAILKIISNYASESIVKATAEVPVSKLRADLDEASQIARDIELATKYANLDPFRATTHNKGAMNGIDAVVLASGNDWRAVEAAVHSYASRNGKYQSITTWDYIEGEEVLRGSIEIPMPIGTVGGTININPISKWALRTLGSPTAKELSSIIASVGLAQNFSALRALVSVGIQEGHMNLHARSVAVQAGAKDEEIQFVVDELNKVNKYSLDLAKAILNKLRGMRN